MPTAFNFNADNNNIDQDQRFSIEGTEYVLTTYFNSRNFEGDANGVGSWFVDINTVNDEPIASGLKLVPFQDVFATPILRSIFTGSLILIDSDGVFDDEITATNYGTGKRYELYYFTQEELQNL